VPIAEAIDFLEYDGTGEPNSRLSKKQLLTSEAGHARGDPMLGIEPDWWLRMAYGQVAEASESCR